MMRRVSALFAYCLTCIVGLAACESKPEPAPRATPQAQANANAHPGEHAPEQRLPPGHPPVAPGSAPGKATGPAPSQAAEAGGLTWTAEAPLERQAPESAMRAAQYGVSGEAGPGELTVFYFGSGQGGSVQDNLNRWIGQLEQPGGGDSREAADITRKQSAHGIEVTTLDVTGTFRGMSRPGMPAAEPQPDHRMLGAIAEGPEGPVFFKLVGPAATVERAEAAFDALVASIRPTGT